MMSWVYISLFLVLVTWNCAAQARSVSKRQLDFYPENELTPAGLNALSPIFRRAGALPFPAAEYYQRQYPVVPPNYYPVNPDGSIYNPNRFPSANNPFGVDNPPVYNYSRALGDGVIAPSISPKIITVLQGMKPRAIRQAVFTQSKRKVCMSDEAIRSFKTTPASLIAFAINNQLIRADGSLDLDKLAELDPDDTITGDDSLFGGLGVQNARPLSELEQGQPNLIPQGPPQAGALPQPPNTAQLYAPYRGQGNAPLFFPGKRRKKRRAPCSGKIGDIDSLDTATWQPTSDSDEPIVFRGKRHAGHGWDDKLHAHTVEGTREIDPRTGQPITARSLALRQYQYQQFQRLMAQRQQLQQNRLGGGLGGLPPQPVFNAQQQQSISRFYNPNTNPYAKFRQSGINPAVFPYQFQFPTDNSPKPTKPPLLTPLEDIPDPIKALPLAKVSSQPSSSFGRRRKRQIGTSRSVSVPFIGPITSGSSVSTPFLGGGNPVGGVNPAGTIGTSRGVNTPFGGVGRSSNVNIPFVNNLAGGNPAGANPLAGGNPLGVTSTRNVGTPFGGVSSSRGFGLDGGLSGTAFEGANKQPLAPVVAAHAPQPHAPQPHTPQTEHATVDHGDPNSDLDARQLEQLENQGLPRPTVTNFIPFAGGQRPTQPLNQPSVPSVPVENCLSEVYYVGPSPQYPQGTLLDICGRPVAAELLLGPGQRVNYWPANPGNAIRFTPSPDNVETRKPDPFDQFPLATDAPKTKKPKKPKKKTTKKPKKPKKPKRPKPTSAPEVETTEIFDDFTIDDVVLAGGGGNGGDSASITADELAALLSG